MAILYGTQSNGETLPVLVDQFGNLLAKGIEGQEGPPGPPGAPGVGQLPPDPYEGAILGWEDGQLAWLGGSAPLPAGTYGPFIYIEGNEQLNIPQDATGLVNGQQLYMSDSQGNQSVHTYRTDTIAGVDVSTPLPINVTAEEALSNKANALDGDWATYATSNSLMTVTFADTVIKPGHSFWTKADQGSSDTTTITIYFADLSYVSYSINNQTTNQFLIWRNDTNSAVTVDTVTFIRTKSSGSLHTAYVSAFAIVPDSAGLGTTPGDKAAVQALEPYTLKPGNSNIVLTFPTSNNFDKFEVGDVVQDPYVITAIDNSGPTITVDGGSWGTGGSDTPSDLKTYWSGEGSVFVGLDQAIVLRGNNKKWVDDYYVTAPEQRVAARKLGLNAKRSSLSATSKQ